MHIIAIRQPFTQKLPTRLAGPGQGLWNLPGAGIDGDAARNALGSGHDSKTTTKGVKATAHRDFSGAIRDLCIILFFTPPLIFLSKRSQSGPAPIRPGTVWEVEKVVEFTILSQSSDKIAFTHH